MAYSPIIKPSDFFETILYNGTGSTLSITSLDFQPDWVWLKRRNALAGHKIQDSVRGAAKQLFSNNSNGEQSNSDLVTSFNSDGFTLSTNTDINGSGGTYVAWNWKAGTSFTNDASSTGIGSIDSSGSLNNDAGFSIVSYTGTGSNATVKHGLSSAPAMIIVKSRSNTDSWYVYHQGIGNTVAIFLDDTSATSASSSYWQNTNPTSSVFSIGTGNAVNRSGGTFITYCFAEKKGYSKFGKYTGNGNADGTFVYTGFKPAWVMCKITNTTDDWYMFNNKMPGYNLINESLRANTADAQNSTGQIDFTSNGFKTRTSNYAVNGGSQSYIYMAFAENPFVASNYNVATAQ